MVWESGIFLRGRGVKGRESAFRLRMREAKEGQERRER
jgi:hypothetical protein